MKLFFITNIAIFALGLIASRLTQANLLITNGQDVLLSDFPWQVSLQQKQGPHFCGGSIISSRFVITAAHCLKGYRPADIKIMAGGTGSLHQLGNLPNIKAFHIHPEFSDWAGTINRADIALIELTEEIIYTDTIQPINLPHRDISLEVQTPSDYLHKLSITGWGFNQNGIIANQLQSIDNLSLLPTITSKFWDDKKNLELIEDQEFSINLFNMFETYRTGHYLGIMVKDKKSSCRGDSGGPIIVRNKDDNFLVGISAHGPHIDCLKRKVFYITNIYVFLSWIDEIIKFEGKT